MSYLISRNVAITALNEAQIEYDVNYRGLGEAKEIIDSLPTVNAIVIPDNATNGDMIKALFSIHKETFTNYGTIKVYGFDSEKMPTEFLVDWWNAPYKKGESNEI